MVQEPIRIMKNEKVWITQMYLCNANKMKKPSLTICIMHLTLLTGLRTLCFCTERQNCWLTPGQKMVFTSVGSHLSGISGSTRGAL